VTAAPIDFRALIGGIRAIDEPPPTFGADGRVTFYPAWHGERMRRGGDYFAWWERLSNVERARYHAELAEHERDVRIAEARQREEAARLDRENRIHELKRRGVPSKDRARIVDGLDDTPALAAARAFSDSGDKHLLVLAGPAGVGKSVAAAWLVATHARSAIFIDQSRLVRKSRYADSDMAPLEDVSLLAIDDLGSEYLDERGSFLTSIDGLINARYSEERPTVITTNLSSARFMMRYGERISDRIREVGRFIEFRGPSLRGPR
jgi:DNA replication protein DnaC